MKEKNNKILLIVGLFALIVMLGGITYSFFNYTRTGTSNTLKVGRISFTSSQNGSINLTNAFPISSADAETDTTNAKSVVITITGDTDYTGGVEYVVTASDVNLSVGNKKLPVTLEITVDGSGDLGTEETGDYYTNRNSYTESKYKIEYKGELEEGSHLLVGYIKSNTATSTIEGINGIVNIKAYIDSDKIKISDTYDGTESDNMGTTSEWVGDRIVFTTEEWNSIASSNTPLSFKVKVEANEGIWVEEPLTFGEMIKRKASTANYIASYKDITDQQAYSTFTTHDQVSDNATKQTVYYYTGNEAAANSNVLFAGYCWQIVSTTDNGGVLAVTGFCANPLYIILTPPLSVVLTICQQYPAKRTLEFAAASLPV